MDLSEFRTYKNMKEVAEDYGYSLNREDKISCPFHNERTPSMKIYDDHFHCFGCGAHGDVVDFVARVTGTDKISAAKEIRDKYCLDICNVTTKKSVLAKLEKAEQEKEINYFLKTLTEFCKVKEAYLETKNLTMAERVKIRQDIDYADGIFDMLINSSRNKRYELVQSMKVVLDYFEKGIENIGIKLKRSKGNEVI